IRQAHSRAPALTEGPAKKEVGYLSAMLADGTLAVGSRGDSAFPACDDSSVKRTRSRTPCKGVRSLVARQACGPATMSSAASSMSCRATDALLLSMRLLLPVISQAVHGSNARTTCSISLMVSRRVTPTGDWHYSPQTAGGAHDNLPSIFIATS